MEPELNNRNGAPTPTPPEPRHVPIPWMDAPGSWLALAGVLEDGRGRIGGVLMHVNAIAQHFGCLFSQYLMHTAT